MGRIVSFKIHVHLEPWNVTLFESKVFAAMYNVRRYGPTLRTGLFIRRHLNIHRGGEVYLKKETEIRVIHLHAQDY